jgi:DNA repair protein RecN (Recombination protein N)
MHLLRGTRASAELVRSDAREASVSATLAVAPALRQRVHDLLESAGIPFADEIIVRRSVSREGRSRAFINDVAVTVSLLERVVGEHVEMIGQNEGTSLARRDVQRDLLDAYAGHEAMRQSVALAHAAHRAALAKLAQLESVARERQQRLEYVGFLLEELEALGLVAGEYEQLESRLARVRHAAKLGEGVGRAATLLSESEPSASDLLRQSRHLLGKLASIDESLGSYLLRLDALASELDGVADDLRGYLLDMEGVDDVDQLETRHEQIRKLARKHALAPEELIGRVDSLRSERDSLIGVEAALAGASHHLAETALVLQEAGRTLAAARRTAAPLAAAALQAAARPLALPHATVELRVEALAEGVIAEHGADEVEILFCANPGDKPRPLGKVASGGEISRLMVAFKSVLLRGDPAVIYLFDEVDVGIGGATAETLGGLLRALGRDRQIFAITHMPQVAAYGQHHLMVEKEVREGRTVSQIETLDADGRVEELARMLGGTTKSDAARTAARELLARGALAGG